MMSKQWLDISAEKVLIAKAKPNAIQNHAVI